MPALNKSTLVRGALCAFAAVTAWVLVTQVAAVRQAASWLDDVVLAYAAPRLPQREDIIVLAIDEDTLAQLPFRSPVSRRFLADTVAELSRRDVRAVGIDVIFDQPTFEDEDRALLTTVDALDVPVVFAAGRVGDGLTPRQIEFQQRYLAGRRLGTASVYVIDGVVRALYPYGPEGTDELPSFPVALARALGITVDAAPQRLLFRATAADGTPPLRKFSIHRLALLPRTWFENAIVLIGADLPNADRFRTPLSAVGDGAAMAGVEIHGQALAQLLDGTVYPSLAPAWSWLLLIAATLAGFSIPLAPASVPIKALGAVGALGAYGVGTFALFAAGGPQLTLLLPTLGFVLGASFSSAYERHRDQSAKRALQNAFEHYLAPPIIEQITKDPGKLVLGGEEREMSFVFSDLSGFTTLAEQLTPAATVSLLQGYFEGMLEIALKLGGTVDRLVGDSVLVFFGAPVHQPDHARRAVMCALEWDRFCDRFRREQLARGVPLGETRIGVHTGLAIVGNVGSESRFQYTVHGDSVNVAARLERVNKHLGTRACLSADAVRHYPEGTFRPVGHLVLKGRSQAVECVTIAEGMAPAEVEAYRIAYTMMQARDPRSAELFAGLVEQLPQDVLTAYHAARLSRGESGATIVLEEK